MTAVVATARMLRAIRYDWEPLMQPPLNIWPNTPASRGTLFFAQAMKAFLDPNSFEGFRAYSLDTLTRLDEAISLGEDVLAKRVPATVLPVVFEELAWSITSDRAARAIAPQECELVTSSCPATDLSTREKIDLLRLLKLRISPAYFERLRDEVVGCVNDEKRRIPLLVSAGFLASHLINQGHSRGFLIVA